MSHSQYWSTQVNGMASLLILVGLLQINLFNGEPHVFTLKEKSPIGHIVIENLGQLLGSGPTGLSYAKSPQILAIGTVETPDADFLAIDRATGNLIVKSPPDRDFICGPTKASSLMVVERSGNSIELIPIDSGYNLNPYISSFQESCSVKLSIVHGAQSDPKFDEITILLEDKNDHSPNFDHVLPKENFPYASRDYIVHVKELPDSYQVESSGISQLPNAVSLNNEGDLISRLSKIRIPLPIAIDTDYGINGVVYYRLEGEDSYLFRLSAEIETQTQSGGLLHLYLSPKIPQGLLTRGAIESNQITSLFDRETRGEYRLVLVAEDAGNPQKSGRLNVRVLVDDLNDMIPQFTQNEYKTSMSQDEPAGHKLLQFSAIDQDSDLNNCKIGFRIPTDPTSSNFNTISQKAAANLFEVELETSKGSSQSKYSGQKPRLQNATNGILVIKKLANDNRKETMNKILELAKILSTHDGSTSRVFEFKIEVYDHGLPQLSSQVPILLTIKSTNNQGPEITINYLNKQEPPDSRLAKMGQAWGIVTENQDRAMLAHVTIFDPDALASAPLDDLRCVLNDERFSLEDLPSKNTQIANSGLRKMLKLMSIKSLDRESLNTNVPGQMIQDRFSFAIKCVDNFHGLLPGGQKTSTSEVRVQIGDQNDNAPHFERANYIFRVYENQPDLSKIYEESIYENYDITPRHYIGSVKAIDFDMGANAAIEYRLASNPNGALDIDTNNGSLYVIRPFDRESQNRIEFKVLAIDNNPDYKDGVTKDGSIRLTGSTTVIINIDDANDCVPVFQPTNCHFQIMENRDTVDIGNVTATDCDEGEAGRITYRLAISGSINQKNNAHYYNDPSIFSYFQIDSQTGQLRLRRRLDREERMSYEFLVLAIDNPQANFINSDKIIDKELVKQNTGTATIMITVLDENDNAPTIEIPRNQEEFFVPVSQLSAGNNIFSIKASDPDFGDNAIIKYSLVSLASTFSQSTQDSNSTTSRNESMPVAESLQQSHFNNVKFDGPPIACNELTGSCLLNRSIPPDFKLPQTYTFRIKAYDMGQPNSMNSSVLVKVTLGSEDPKLSTLDLNNGKRSLGLFSDLDGRSRWSGRSLMVILASAFILLLIFAVFLLLLIRFRGGLMHSVLFRVGNQRSRKNPEYNSVQKINSSAKNFVNEIHVSPWANLPNTESPTTKILYSNPILPVGNNERFMTSTLSPQLYYKNLNTRGWNTTSNAAKTMVSFEPSISEKPQSNEASPCKINTHPRSPEDGRYGALAPNSTYILKNYDPLSIPFSSPSMTLGRRVHHSQKNSNTTYTKLLTAQPNRRQMPLLNMRSANSLEDQLDGEENRVYTNNNFTYFMELDDLEKGCTGISNTHANDNNKMYWYKTSIFNSPANQFKRTNDTELSPSKKASIYQQRSGHFPQDLTPILNYKISRNSNHFTSDNEQTGRIRMNLKPFTIPQLENSPNCSEAHCSEDLFFENSPNPLRQIRCSSRNERRINSQASSISSQGNDDSGVQITSSETNHAIQFMNGIEGSFV